MKKKIKFLKGSSSPFFVSLNKEVDKLLSQNNLAKAHKLLWTKMIFYFSLHILSYIILYLFPHDSLFGLVLNFVFVGLSGMLLAYNVSHDACHGTFSKNPRINYLLYHLSFNMQGTNAYLWKIRHVSSHHLFPNVDGCDADIDDNPMIRLSPQHPIRKHQRYQHIYAFLLYCIYTLHWFVFKDLLYLSKKKLANLEAIKHPIHEYFLFLLWKIIYLIAMVYIPLVLGYSLSHVITAFFLMHVVNSLFFIHSLIATHLCLETQFPKPDKEGFLTYDYYIHQLATSLDFSPTSRLFNWIFGGFNAHAAHHLYPKLPHTIYPLISPVIERTAKEFNVRYNKLDLLKAIKSHYKYLKLMGSKIS